VYKYTSNSAGPGHARVDSELQEVRGHDRGWQSLPDAEAGGVVQRSVQLDDHPRSLNLGPFDSRRSTSQYIGPSGQVRQVELVAGRDGKAIDPLLIELVRLTVPAFQPTDTTGTGRTVFSLR